MLKLVLLLLPFTLIILSSCNDGRKEVHSSHPDGFYEEVFQVNKENVRDGKYEKFYKNGIKADSCFYANGNIHGLRKIFTPEGKLEIEESYENGNFEGPYKTFYTNKQVKKIQNYSNNQIQGKVKEFYPDGTLKAVIQFTNNLENGPFSEYHQNGNLHWEGFYEGGDFEQDTLKEYNIQGELIRKLYCEKGICQTIWTPEKGYIKAKEIFED